MGNSITINLNDAISYGSMIELKNIFRPNNETALIACALKSRKIVIIMLLPGGHDPNEDTDVSMESERTGRTDREVSQQGSRYFILKTIMTDMKPTCLV
mgnify:CR=1 FL=1